MIKGSWGKKGAAGAMSAVRSSVSGLFTGLVRDAGRPAKTSPGSALSQTERVTNALRAANKQTQTFKPKNAR